MPITPASGFRAAHSCVMPPGSSWTETLEGVLDVNMVLNSQTNNPSKTLLIADAELKGIELLLSGELKADHILLVQRDDDALFKLERYLNSAGREFSQYFILCHGAPGKLKLGAHEIDTNQLAARTSLNLGLSKWMRGKRLGLIACSVSAQECGVRMLEALGQHWGVRVSASPTKLGQHLELELPAQQ